MPQKHDLGVQKRARATLRKPKELTEREPSRWANWCRVYGHPPSCCCVYIFGSVLKRG